MIVRSVAIARCWVLADVRVPRRSENEVAMKHYFGAAFLLSYLTLVLVVAAVLAAQDQRNREQDELIRRLAEANRLQDAHNVNTSWALMRAALTDVQAGRDEQARSLAISAIAGLIGLHHHPCGGSQTIPVPAAHVPQDLRRFFGEGEPYTIVGTEGSGADEVLLIRVNAEQTC